jgi:hypothetical protein
MRSNCCPGIRACGSWGVEGGGRGVDAGCYPGEAGGVYVKGCWVAIFFGEDACLAIGDGIVEIAQCLAGWRWCGGPSGVPSVLEGA